MQWKPFLHKFNENSWAKNLPHPATVQFLDGSVNSEDKLRNPWKPPSNGHLGEDVHSADLGGYPPVFALLFDADYGGLAADPALLA